MQGNDKILSIAVGRTPSGAFSAYISVTGGKDGKSMESLRILGSTPAEVGSAVTELLEQDPLFEQVGAPNSATG